MIERNILIGFIVSTEFNQRMQDKWDVSLFESATAKRMVSWTKEYFEKYNAAPGKAIEPIFYDKVKNGLSKDLAEEIEEDILPSLSKQYEDENLNVEYLVDKATAYFSERNLIKHANDIIALAETNQLTEAESKASSYKPLAKDCGAWIDLADEKSLADIHRAFTHASEPLIKFPRELGKFWNQQLVRGGFVALFGPEKRGKTFWLLELGLRACKQGKKVAFFQAGDMSKEEQLKRICIYLAKKSNIEMYCEKMFEPVRDCILHQLDICRREEREADEPNLFANLSTSGKEPLEKITEANIRKTISLNHIKAAWKDYKDHMPCTNCRKFRGTVWVKEIPSVDPLETNQAEKQIKSFFIKHKRSFKLSTHSNSTLSVKESSAIMDIWEKQEDFVPDVILYDYPDIMIDPTNEFRHKQNEIWKALRGVSQKRHALVICVTQADANSYEKDLLSLKNFSEDKRKFGHVTAFYGLNQDPKGREKELGIMRINEIVVREGDFNTSNQIYVLQNLRRGRPFLTSYY